MPRYQKPIERDLLTSMIVPMNQAGEKLGVINLESEDFVEPTHVAKKELRLLADAIAELYVAKESSDSHRRNVRQVIDDLRDILDEAALPALTKPHIFVASSGSADKEVVGHIRKALAKFDTSLEAVMWSDVMQSGNINQQILADITKSRFGLCYMSEPSDGDDGPTYRDNLNVVFEAGMLHSLTNAPTGEPVGWIPIRELDSPEMPFDFGHERILIVPRDNEALNVDLFHHELEQRLRAILGDKHA